MERISSFLAGNNGNLEALLSPSLENPSEAGVLLLHALRQLPDYSKHSAFEDNFFKLLGSYCAAARQGTAEARILPMQMSSLKWLEAVAVNTLSSMLESAKMESIAGFVIDVVVLCDLVSLGANCAII